MPARGTGTAPVGQRVEFRCPEPRYSAQGRRYSGPLFAVAVFTDGPAVVPGALEYACQRCKQRLARSGHPAQRVIHRFSFSGVLLETVTEGPLV